MKRHHRHHRATQFLTTGRWLVLGFLVVATFMVALGWHHYDRTHPATAIAQIASATMQVSSPVPGSLKTSAAKPGSSVKEGDLLFEIARNEALPSVPIVAPVSGVVIDVGAIEGRHVSAGTVLAKIANNSTWFVDAFFPVDRLEQIPVGSEAIVTIDRSPVKRFFGKVVSVSGAPQGGLVPIRIKLDPSDAIDPSYDGRNAQVTVDTTKIRQN